MQHLESQGVVRKELKRRDLHSISSFFQKNIMEPEQMILQAGATCRRAGGATCRRADALALIRISRRCGGRRIRQGPRTQRSSWTDGRAYWLRGGVPAPTRPQKPHP